MQAPGQSPSFPDAQRQRRTFFLALTLATAVPLVVLPVYSLMPALAHSLIAPAVLSVWVATGYVHVVSTLWFGADPHYDSVVRGHRWRMIVAPLLTPLTIGTIAMADRQVSAWLYAAFLIWQAHHYNRQNYGILSFAAARDGLGRLPMGVGVALNLTTVAGATGMVSLPTIYPRGLPLLPFQTGETALAGRCLAIACFICAAGLLVTLVWRNEQLRRARTVVAFLALSWAFFIPGLFPGAPQAAFWPFAMAHGAQYLVIMAITVRRAPRVWSRIAAISAAALAIGAAAFQLPTLVLNQAYMGLVVCHFLADARLWRLRDPAVSKVVRRRFDFLFPPPSIPGRIHALRLVGPETEASHGGLPAGLSQFSTPVAILPTPKVGPPPHGTPA